MNARTKTRAKGREDREGLRELQGHSSCLQVCGATEGPGQTLPQPQVDTDSSAAAVWWEGAVTALQTCLLKMRVGLGGRGAMGTEARQLDKRMEICLVQILSNPM